MAKTRIIGPAPSSTLMPATSPGGEGNGMAPHRSGGPAPVGQTISDVLAQGSPREAYTPGGRKGRGGPGPATTQLWPGDCPK
jgi:hypothetical protein